MRNPGLPKVAIFGLTRDQLPPPDQLRSHPAPEFEADDFAITVYPDDSELHRVLAELDPQAIVTVGVMEDFHNLMAAPYRVRRKWIHRDRAQDITGIDIFQCFLAAALPGYGNPSAPRTISVFTPIYNTGGDRLRRTWESLRRQTYVDWEWVIADDASDDPGTIAAIAEIAADHRVSIHSLKRPSGNIGELKGHLCAAASGDVLLELDHDDVLTPFALGWVAKAFEDHPECGVAYTNWAEQYAGTDRFHVYPAGYGFGYGKAHWETHPMNYETFEPGDVAYLVQDAMNINAKTIRHIVGVPNHIRAWTREAYNAAGGYSRLHVGDDYELLVRLFLHTRFVHIPVLGYVQFYNPESIGNTQDARRREIQRIVRFVGDHYGARIHERLLELGVDDYVWDEAAGRPDFSRLNRAPESHCTVAMEVG